MNKGSYQYTLITNDNDTYSFVGIDMCPRPGAGRPFNFLGYINKVLFSKKHRDLTFVFVGRNGTSSKII